MEKSDRLSEVASAAYSIGYGSKIHQSTLDMALKIPGWINFSSLAIGVIALIEMRAATPVPAATLIIAGIGSIYFSHYQDRATEYDRIAKELLQRYYQLQDIARQMEGTDDEAALEQLSKDASEIRDGAKSVAISRQIFLANWYAHYKFFGSRRFRGSSALESQHFHSGETRCRLASRFSSFCVPLD